MLIGLAVGGVGGLMIRGRKSRWELEVACAPAQSVESFVAKVASRVTALTALVCWNEAARELVRRGFAGSSVRAFFMGAPPSVSPLLEPFEPRLLDESDSAFEELRKSLLQSAPEDADAPPENRVERVRDVLLSKSVRRNVLIKGGWLFVGISGFNTLAAGLVSWKSGRPTPDLILWGALTLAALFIPAATTASSRHQWLIVPGGLVHRQAKWRDLRAGVQLFRRDESVLCVIQRTRQAWYVCVANDRESGSTLATNVEVDLLLRAWLSPVPPPTAEKLSDFA